MSDVKTIIDIESTVYETPWTRMSFVNELRHNRYASYYLLECNDEVIAYGGIWNVIDEAHLTNIAVKKEHQKKGYGTKMLAYLEDQAIRRGAKAITLEVRESNISAQKLYEKHGYIAKGRRVRYYTDKNEDAIVMWKIFDEEFVLDE